jgi:arylsulfatase A-like enzyme
MIPRHDQFVYNERPSYGEVIVPADSTTGTHSRDGIFIAWGTGIKAGATFNTGPNLRDVGPTALAALGLPLTEDMDGRELSEVFEEKVERSRIGSSYRDAISSAATAYTTSEEAQLRKRLRGLGYIE